MVTSDGGEGGSAERTVKCLRRHCNTLRMVVPDLAASAATVCCLGADEIVMSEDGELTKIDPQVKFDWDRYASANLVIDTFKHFEAKAKSNPAMSPFYAAAMCPPVDANTIHYAFSHLAHMEYLHNELFDLRKEPPTETERQKIVIELSGGYEHSFSYGLGKLSALGLPVSHLYDQDPSDSLIELHKAMLSYCDTTTFTHIVDHMFDRCDIQAMLITKDDLLVRRTS